MPEKLLAGMLLLLVFGCNAPQPQPQAKTELRKVAIRSPQDLERLRGLGVEIIVREKEYAVIRRDSTQVRALSDAGIETSAIQESDLIQRLVRVHFGSRQELQQIVDMGFDVWEVEGDSVLARGFDSYLDRLDRVGVGYRHVTLDTTRAEGRP